MTRRLDDLDLVAFMVDGRGSDTASSGSGSLPSTSSMEPPPRCQQADTNHVRQVTDVRAAVRHADRSRSIPAGHRVRSRPAMATHPAPATPSSPFPEASTDAIRLHPGTPAGLRGLHPQLDILDLLRRPVHRRAHVPPAGRGPPHPR